MKVFCLFLCLLWTVAGKADQVLIEDLLKQDFYESLRVGGLPTNCVKEHALECDQQQRMIYLFAERHSVSIPGWVMTAAPLKADYPFPKAVPPSQVQELLSRSVSHQHFYSGRYQALPEAYVFCRTQRKYPCQIAIRQPNGQWLRSEDGGLWSLPILGYSKKRKPYYKVDGNTPFGVYRIDGVMPEANNRWVFGSFRRLILNFVSPQNEGQLLGNLIPSSHEGLFWWQATQVARDQGRDLFRIHGTGLGHRNRRSSYYSFVSTRGCLTTREGHYDRVRYRDQQILLDALMRAQGLNVESANEHFIRALLFVLPISEDDRAVEREDIEGLIAESMSSGYESKVY